MHRRHPAQRRLGTGRRADQVRLHVGNGVPLLRGQSHVDADVLATPLHAQRFIAEERGTDLLRQSIKREPESPRFRTQLELNLLQARRMVRPDVEHAVELAESRRHCVAERAEAAGIGMGQLDLDRRPDVEEVGREGETARFRDGPGLLAPRLHERRGADVAPLRRQQLELHGGDVTLRPQAGLLNDGTAQLPRPHPHRRVDPDQQGLGVRGPAPVQPVDGPATRRLQVAGELRGTPRGRPLGHLQVGGDDVGRHRFGEDDADDAGGDQGDREDDHPDAAGDHHGRAAGGRSQCPVEGTLHQPLEPPIHAGLDPAWRRGRTSRPRCDRRKGPETLPAPGCSSKRARPPR